MYACIEVFGIISNVMNIGEYDRRITIITKEKGKISAFARGARKANSSFIASTRLFAFANSPYMRERKLIIYSRQILVIILRIYQQILKILATLLIFWNWQIIIQKNF